MYRFLLKPWWILSHLLVLALVVVMINLGLWQLHRLQEKRDFNALVESRQDLPVEPVQDVLPATAEFADADGVVFRIDPFRGTSRIDSTLEGTISPLGMLVLEDGDLLIFDANADPKRLGAPIGALFRHRRATQRTECLVQVPRFRDPVRGTYGPDGRVWFVDANSDPEKRGPDAPGRGQNLTGPGAVFALSLQDSALELIGSPPQFVNPTGILWRP